MLQSGQSNTGSNCLSICANVTSFEDLIFPGFLQVANKWKNRQKNAIPMSINGRTGG